MSEIPKDRTHFEQLGLFFMVWMGCFLFFSLLAAGSLLAFYGAEVYKVISSSGNVGLENLNSIRFLQILLSIGIFGVPPLVFIFICKPRDWTFFRLGSAPPVKLILLTAVIVALAAPLVLWALDVNQNMSLPSAFKTWEDYLRDLEDKNEKLLETLLIMNSGSDFILNFLMIAMIPAFVEELLFRGTLQQLLAKVLGDAHLSIIITGIFFSFIHFQFYGFFPRMLLGILLGYIFFWSGNLWLAILAHFLNNGVQVTMVYLFQRGTISINIDDMVSFPPYITMIATVLLFAAVYIFDLAAQSKSTEDGKGLG